MIATPIKKITAAGKKFARFERTIANELPQELSQISRSFGCPALGYSPASGSRRKAGRAKQAAAVTQTDRLTIATNCFMDDGHPTILAAVSGSIRAR